MSEPEPSRPPVVDYRRPTAESPEASQWRRYVPGLLALGVLPTCLTSSGDLAALALLLSVGCAVVQVICAVTHERDSAGRPRRRVLWFPMVLGIVILTMGLAVLIALATKDSRSERTKRVRCMSNLRQIGQAIAVYAGNNAGAYPPSLIPLYTDCGIHPKSFVCPSSDDTAAGGPGTRNVVAKLSQPGHISYVYLGAGMHRSTVTPETIIAHDRLENHRKEGICVLYGDGHTDWVTRSEAKYILSELNAGHNPPRPEPVTTTRSVR